MKPPFPHCETALRVMEEEIEHLAPSPSLGHDECEWFARDRIMEMRREYLRAMGDAEIARYEAESKSLRKEVTGMYGYTQTDRAQDLRSAIWNDKQIAEIREYLERLGAE